MTKHFAEVYRRHCSRCFTQETTRWNSARDKPDSWWCESCYSTWYNKQRKGQRHDWYLRKNQRKIIAENKNLKVQLLRQMEKWHKLQREYPSLKSTKLFSAAKPQWGGRLLGDRTPGVY